MFFFELAAFSGGLRFMLGRAEPEFIRKPRALGVTMCNACPRELIEPGSTQQSYAFRRNNGLAFAAISNGRGSAVKTKPCQGWLGDGRINETEPGTFYI